MRRSARVAWKPARGSTEESIAFAQISAVFKLMPLGCLFVILFSVFMAGYLPKLDMIKPGPAYVWLALIDVISLMGIYVSLGFGRKRPDVSHWHPWAASLVVINFLMGLAWASAPFLLSGPETPEVTLAIMVMTLGFLSHASLATYPFLPCFMVIFLPPVIVGALVGAFSDDPLLRMFFFLESLYLLGTSFLVINADGAFQKVIRMRLRTARMATELEVQKNLAENANRAKSTILASASHDLRQPLHAIGLLAGAMRILDMPEQGHKLLGKMDVAINGMGDMFSSLLNVAQLDARTITPQIKPFAVGEVMARLCDEQSQAAQSKGLMLSFVPCSGLVYSDPTLVESILRNFISNALRYTSHGRILVGCRRRGSGLVLQVLDTGQGIARDQQDKIFQEYYQLANPERDRVKGFGLGLAIVARTAALLDCPVSVRSEVGKGSCFEIVLPLFDGITLPARSFQADAEPEAPTTASGFILVIDDDLQIREAMGRLIVSWGHEVCLAESRAEALTALQLVAKPPDLFICDYRLRAGDNGISVIDELGTQYGTHIPAILITGDTAPDLLAEAQTRKLVILHKPVRNDRLRAAVAVNLDSARSLEHGAIQTSADRSACAQSPAQSPSGMTG